MNTSTSPTIRRTVWISALDDYIGGMTEVSIFLPNYDIDFPFAFDNFNIDIAKWDVFKEHSMEKLKKSISIMINWE